MMLCTAGRRYGACTLLILTGLLYGSPKIKQELSGKEYMAGEFVVKFKSTVELSVHIRNGMALTGIAAVDNLNTRYGCDDLRYIGPRGQRRGGPPLRNSNMRVYRLRLAGEVNELEVAEEYRNTKAFEYVELNWVGRTFGMAKARRACTIPNDEYFYTQWALNNDGTYTENGLFETRADVDIDMPEAWDIEKGDSSIIVCILDSGCRLDHPDLAGRIWTNPGEVAGNGIDDDNNGYVDDVHGYDFIDDDGDPSDGDGHGTSLAGVLGAVADNGVGLAGIDQKCKVMVCKEVDALGHTSVAAVLEAMQYGISNGATVLNLSFGVPEIAELDSALTQAHSAGVIAVAASGNTDVESIEFPANHRFVLAVGATTTMDHRLAKSMYGSSYGPELDVVAPGEFIFSLAHQGIDDYATYWDGTSIAVPFVCGLASLLLAQDPSRTPDQIKQIITQSAEDQVGDASEDTPGWDKYYGYGRINAYDALKLGAAIKSGLTTYAQSSRPRVLRIPSGEVRIRVGNEGIDQAQVYDLRGRTLGGFSRAQECPSELSVPGRGLLVVRMRRKEGGQIREKLIAY